MQKSLKRKSTRRRVIRYSLVALNAAILVAVISFVAISSRADHNSVNSLSAAGSAAVNPVDRLTSYDIAANVANIVSLPEKTAITNQAQSAKVSVVVSSNDSAVIAKPQIVATALKSRKDIQAYTVVNGDTVTSVAQKFGITSDSVRWSNNIVGDTVSPGTKLIIPPVDGIVYTVVAGDTPQSLATKYRANADQIIEYNDAELSNIQVGEQIVIPGGQQVQTQTRAVVSSGSGNLVSSAALTTVYAGNGYDPGYCTWYVYNQRAAIGRPIGSNWGNAVSWASYALSAGFKVDHTPEVGAIQQNGGGLGHVAIVTAVNADGSYTVSEMNFVGFNRTSTRNLTAAEAATYNFIH